MRDSEFTLPLSFSLASEIGLEESVLLSFLRQHAFCIQNNVLHFPEGSLASLLPFWTAPILIRHLNSLQAMTLIQYRRTNVGIDIQLCNPNKSESVASDIPASHNASVSSGSENVDVRTQDDVVSKVGKLQREAREKTHSTPVSPPNSVTRATPAGNASGASSSTRNLRSDAPNYSAKQSDPYYTPGYPATQDRRGVSDFDLYLEQKERTRQPDQWQPEEATIEQICQSGIPRQFATELQTEFLLRIREQRKNVRTWNSEFFKYVKRQWQYKQSDRQSHEGTSVSTTSGKSSREQVSSALTNIHDTDW